MYAVTETFKRANDDDDPAQDGKAHATLFLDGTSFVIDISTGDVRVALNGYGENVVAIVTNPDLTWPVDVTWWRIEERLHEAAKAWFKVVNEVHPNEDLL
jgi:hypothetical protein